MRNFAHTAMKRFGMKRVLRWLVYAALSGLSAMPTAWAELAQTPVKVVVPYPAGGPGDVLGRLVADLLSKAEKRDYVVENRPGAGGVIAALAVSKMPADGRNLLISAVGSLVIAPAYADAGYDPLRDFSHIAIFGGVPMVLVASPKLPVSDLKTLLAYASDPKVGLAWGSLGRSVPHLTGEMLMASHGLSHVVHVDYKGDGPLLNDLLGGHIQAAMMGLGSANAHIKAGKLRPIALAAPRRSAEFKDLPTFAELGYPQLTSTVWFGLSAPAGLPTEQVQRLNRAVRKGLRQVQAQNGLRSHDIDYYDLDPQETVRFIDTEIRRWQPMIQALEARPKSPH